MKKVSAKVETWSDTSITCLWTRTLPIGTYNLFVKPNGAKSSPIAEGMFTIMSPEIDDINPQILTAGATITVDGQFFTNRKPKVYLKDLNTQKRKNCKVFSSTMDPATGASSLKFTVTKLGSGNYEIVLQTLIGEVSIDTMVSISGKVTDSKTEDGISGVTMTLTGTNSVSIITGNDGTYSFTGIQNGEYTISPSKEGYSFSPQSIAVTLDNSDISGQDFLGTNTVATIPFDFSLQAQAEEFSTFQGGTGNVVFDVSVLSGEKQPVSFSIFGCPPSATCIMSPNAVFDEDSAGLRFVGLFVVTSPNTPTGIFPLIIQGTSGEATRLANINLCITAPQGDRPIKAWAPYGVPVSIALGHQDRTVAITDGSGGAILVWADSRLSFSGSSPGYQEIYGQRITSTGVGLWKAGGMPISTFDKDIGSFNYNRNKDDPSIASDGTGDAIVTWVDTRYLQGDIFAQKIDLSGNKLWQTNGVPVSTACWSNGACANYKCNPQIVSAGVGGAIITWWEMRDGFNSSVWAQRILANGQPSWLIDGVPVATGSFDATWPKIVSDGNGGAIIAWQDSRRISEHLVLIYAQRLNQDGLPIWMSNGIEISRHGGQSGAQGFSLISDGSGGAIISWVDNRFFDPNDSNIYAQKVSANGQIQWQQGGVPICTRAGFQYSPVMINDGAGGAIIAWEDQSQISAQRISAQGTTLWAANGIAVCSPYCSGPSIISDGSGGAFIVFAGLSSGSPAIYAQRIDGSGQSLWLPGAFEVFSQSEVAYGHGRGAVSDGNGAAIIYWMDDRLNLTFGGITNWDIFAQRITERFP